MPPLNPTPWRSLAELERDPAFLERLADEFPENQEQLASPVSRRRFMQLMGASLAFASATGCRRWERDEIVPLSERPEGRTPGVPEYLATAFELGGAAAGLLVSCYDGRPIKIEGNPDHPDTGGASTAFAQASILELYDPDRKTAVTHEGRARSWDDFEAFARARMNALRAAGGAGLRFLSEATTSPTSARLRARLAVELPHARWHTWEPLSRDHERDGLRAAFGAPHRLHLHLREASVIAAFDADVLVDHPSALRLAREWASVRDPRAETMARLYAIESSFSATGGAADHRLPLPSREIVPALRALEARLAGRAGDPDHPVLAALARDLERAGAGGVVAVGYRQPPEAHAIAARINAALGSRAVAYSADDDPRPSHLDDLRALVAAMQGGEVDTLIVLGGNPCYDAPADVPFAAALANIPASVHLSAYDDETSAQCTWHLPRAHQLEAWGDARTPDGTITVQQPTIQPLHGGRSAIQLVSLLLDGHADDTDAAVRATFAGTAAAWRKAVHDGYVAGTAYATVTPAPLPGASVSAGGPRGKDGLELVLMPSAASYDGRFANNAWLQEAPEFMTKLTWDNAALIGPATAQRVGVSHGDVVRITTGGRALEVPAYVMPGQAPGSIALALGYGRRRAGVVGTGVGADAYALRNSDALYVAGGVTVERTGRRHALATTQEHWAIDARGQETVQIRARDFVRTAALTRFRDDPGHVHAGEHHVPDAELFEGHAYDGHRWGMTTDLGACVGCNACVVACQAENNVPVVGKEQVLRNREMHWLRLDRYFVGDPDDPQLAHQPVACQHCENAPCEQVCPVGATLHSSEGLNDMVYNRCVGTRYCANNCPYKVRRFNFLDFHGDVPGPRQLLFNPDVTVRSRGVMEKCSMCVQRIQRVKIAANNEDRAIRDGEIAPACVQVCPTRAIAFGDLNDPASRVAALSADDRAYDLLGELATRPRNKYLARVRNPNPEIES